ncbi:MAG TPA: T9SS type A sorting domain-containing protein, partial [Bacteroidia bacterium]|nr:T9SS type A sorting domain-containing protein [Bacteroidia bacterium]
NIKYATRSVGGGTIQYLKNSSFTNNEYGFYNISFPVDSCAFKSNDIGISSLSNVTLNFCSISNNNFGVESSGNNVILNNCTINSNSLGFGGATGQTAGTKFYGCRISHNNTGVTTHSFAGNVFRDCIINYNTSLGIASYPIMGIDSIINCEIKFNGTGVTAQSSSGCVITQCEFEYDTIGIVIKNSSADIYCNKICNNISYGLKMDVSTNFNVSNNYWCTTDSTQIAAAIYDGYDNVAVGLVTFLPLDSLCYTSTGITAYEAQPASFSIFPNPAADDITIELPANSSKAEIKIYNMPGQLIYSSRLTKQKTTIDISAFRKGAYIIQIATADAISRQKLIRQ